MSAPDWKLNPNVECRVVLERLKIWHATAMTVGSINITNESKLSMSLNIVSNIDVCDHAISSEDMKPAISVTKPPLEHVNNFYHIQENLKQEPDEVKCEKDPRLNLDKYNLHLNYESDLNFSENFVTNDDVQLPTLTVSGTNVPYSDEDMSVLTQTIKKPSSKDEPHKSSRFSNCYTNFESISLGRNKMTDLAVENTSQVDVYGMEFPHLYGLSNNEMLVNPVTTPTSEIRSAAHPTFESGSIQLIPCEPRQPKIRKKPLKYKCDECGKYLWCSQALTGHKRTHTGERPFNCEICGKWFSLLSTLAGHKLTHAGKKSLKCYVCGIRFAQSSNLPRHKLTNSREKQSEPVPDLCENCLKNRLHIIGQISVHTVENIYQCDECLKAFDLYHELSTHKKITHAKETFKCQICGVGFSQMHHLTSHESTHKQGKPFKCDECSTCFFTSFHLKDHKMQHHHREKQLPQNVSLFPVDLEQIQLKNRDHDDDKTEYVNHITALETNLNHDTGPGECLEDPLRLE